jgi:4-hydroxybenzoyl-CoA thioesterase
MPAFRHALRVSFDDVDHAGIVYYPRFFHYFHLAFESYIHARFAEAGGYRALIDERRIGFPAVRAEADYKRPLRFGDQVVLELVASRVGDKSVTCAYTVMAAETGEVSCEGRVVCVVTNLDAFRSMRMPDDLRAAFEALR